MEMAEIDTLRLQVLWAAFGLSALFGAVARRTHFCTMGALSDIVHMGDWTRMRMWALAAGVGIAGFSLMAWLGWVDPARSIYHGGRINWLSALVGGALFGLGMVMASGCGSKTLIRVGGGSLKSLVVFLVMGLAAFATLRGVTAVWRAETVDRVFLTPAAGAGLPQWLALAGGWELGDATLGLGLLLGLGLAAWALSGRGFWRPAHLLGGLGTGATLVLMWWVSGHLGLVAEHPETLETVNLGTASGRMEALTFTAPMAHVLDWLIFYSDRQKLLTLGVASVLGVVTGALLESLATRSFRWEGFRDTRDTAMHLAGAVCMGVGGVTAMGCTIGQGLSGLSTLSINSVLAVAGIVLGALAGFRFQLWLIERE